MGQRIGSDNKRYSRHLALPGFDMAQQEALSNAKVLVVGCGGLGNPVLLYLTAAGVGTIGIADDDTITIDNLHRQVLFGESDLGQAKLVAATNKLREMQSSTNFNTYQEKISAQNVASLIAQYDVIIDCTDNFEARFILDDACHTAKTPLVFGAIHRFEGQVSVFHYKTGIRYRDICPEPPEKNAIPNCEIGGVLGTLAGTIGCIQANEAIKIITGIGECLDGKMMIFNMLDVSISHINITHRSRKDAPAETAKRNVGRDNNKQNTSSKMINAITVQEFKKMRDELDDFQLIDVREASEYAEFNLGGELFPLNTIPENFEKISRSKKVIIHCRAGSRSAQAIKYLNEKHGFNNLFNLTGGTIAWQNEIG